MRMDQLTKYEYNIADNSRSCPKGVHSNLGVIVHLPIFYVVLKGIRDNCERNSGNHEKIQHLNKYLNH